MIKSVIMPGNKQAIVVYRLADGRVYCSDANSTAFEFPLSNAKVVTDGACVSITGLVCLGRNTACKVEHAMQLLQAAVHRLRCHWTAQCTN
jgi:hypothetical protein